jgi:hypothetical protein
MSPRELNRITNNNKTAIVKGDGGGYFVEMYINNKLIGSKIFNEHTLRIVEEFAQKWVREDLLE